MIEKRSLPENWVQDAKGLSEEEKQAFVVIDNVSDGKWDFDVLANNWDIDLNEWGLIDWKIEEENEVDYSILDDEEDIDEQLSEMTEGVKKAIQIEFELEDYEEAYELVKYFRETTGDIGGLILVFLRNKKEEDEKN